MARTQVQSELLAVNSISGTIIADNAITATHIATNAISGTLVQDGGIVTVMIAANNVTATKIVTDAIQTRHIADDQVTAAKLANSINTDIATGPAALPKAGGTMTGNIVMGDDTSIGIADDAERIEFDGAGDINILGANLGIGTTSPSHMLHVNAADGASDNTQAMTIENNEATDGRSYGLKIKAGSTVNDASLFVQDHDASNDHFIIRGNGAVGIGTTSPDGQLHVKGDINNTIKLDFTIADGTGTYTLNSYARNGTNKWRLGSKADDSYLSWYNDQTSSHQFALKSDGNVGVGTTAPLVKLDVRGSPSAPATSGTTQTGSIRASQTAGNGVLDMGFYTSSTGTAWIQSTNKSNLATNYGLTLQPNGGNVGIGTPSPSSLLHLESGNAHNKLSITSTASGGTGYDAVIDLLGSASNSEVAINMGINGDADREQIKTYQSAMSFRTNNAAAMQITSSGLVNVLNNGGSSYSSYGKGSALRVSELSYNQSAVHYIEIGGNLPGYAAGQYNCLRTDLGDLHFAAGGVYTGYISYNGDFTDISDEREKENIVTISNATAKLKQLRGVYHTWKDTENRGTDTAIGLIAQEVEAVVPEVVTTSNPPSLNTPESDTAGLKGVAYAKLVPLLIETIKELEARIETLEG